MSGEVDLTNYELIGDGIPDGFTFEEQQERPIRPHGRRSKGLLILSNTTAICISILSGCAKPNETPTITPVPAPTLAPSIREPVDKSEEIESPTSTPSVERIPIPDFIQLQPNDITQTEPFRFYAERRRIETTDYIEPKVKVSPEAYNAAVETAGRPSMSTEDAMEIIRKSGVDLSSVLGGSVSIVTYNDQPPIIMVNESHPAGSARAPGTLNKYGYNSLFNGTPSDSINRSEVKVHTYSIGYDELGRPTLSKIPFPIVMVPADENEQTTYGYDFIVTLKTGQTFTVKGKFSNPELMKMDLLLYLWNQALVDYIIHTDIGEKRKYDTSRLFTFVLPHTTTSVGAPSGGRILFEYGDSVLIADLLEYVIDQIQSVTTLPNYVDPLDNDVPPIEEKKKVDPSLNPLLPPKTKPVVN